MPKGHNIHNANRNVREMLLKCGVTQCELAAAYGISKYHFNRKFSIEWTPNEQLNAMSIIVRIADERAKNEKGVTV